jgi:hypothetical protein
VNRSVQVLTKFFLGEYFVVFVCNHGKYQPFPLIVILAEPGGHGKLLCTAPAKFVVPEPRNQISFMKHRA